ncbi:unnamed protein product, partial [Brenthis ino]
MKVVYFFIVYFLHRSQGYNGSAGPNRDKIVACYYTSWAAYRPGLGSFDISDIEPTLCSHLIYSFVGLDENSFKIKHIDQWQDLEKDGGKGGLKRIVALKEKHKHLKIIVSIGGWNEGSAKYSKMAGDPKLRNVFVKSAVNFLTIHNLDGLDLFWDHPTKRGGVPEDRNNYVSLIKELSEAFEPKGFLLTGSLRSNSGEMNSLYNLEHVNYYLDFLHIMGYEFHGSWDEVIGANAPLHGKDEGDTLNVEYTIKYLLKLGVTPNKIILNLPLFGKTYILTNPGVKGIVYGETATKAVGFSGPFTAEDGFMGYNEICLELANKTSQWVEGWHERSNTPYLWDDDRFISYDNPRSIANKVAFALDHGIGGFAAWTITTDDFRGSCDEEMDTYKDFIERYNKISDQQLMKRALNSLLEAGNKIDHFVAVDDKVRLQLPKATFSNYPLLRTIHDATNIVLEGAKILKEMEKLKGQAQAKPQTDIQKDRIPCIRTCTEICYYGLVNSEMNKMQRSKRTIINYKYVKPSIFKNAPLL